MSETLASLRSRAKDLGLRGYSKLNKADLNVLLELKEYPNEFLRLRNNEPSDYVQISQIGKEGKEGLVYLGLHIKTMQSFAIKTFRKSKSPRMMEKEAYYQYLAAKEGISPAVVEYNTEMKFIVMELLECTLIDLINQQGRLKPFQENQIIELYQKLDRIGVMINDANPLNIMVKNRKLFLIDFGFAKPTCHREFKKYPHPNYQLMPVGLLSWLEKRKYNTQEMKIIRSHISPEMMKVFGI